MRHIHPLMAIVTIVVVGSIAFVPDLHWLASTMLQIVFLYFKTGTRG